MEQLAPCSHFPGDLIERCGRVRRVLEVGVGAGFDAVRFCALGLEYVGVDLSPAAVATATGRLRENGILATVLNVDFHDVSLAAPVDLIFDRGVFHNLSTEAERESFAKKSAQTLSEGGYWISVIGSADNLSASPHGSLYLSNTVPAVERYFEILFLDRRPYGPADWPDNFDAWYCLFRKRKQRS